MGMDAIIEDKDLRFSQLLSSVAYKLYPETKISEGCIEYTYHQISRIIVEMANELDQWSIKDVTGNITLRRIQWQISNSLKLYTLVEWYCQNESKSLTFA